MRPQRLRFVLALTFSCSLFAGQRLADRLTNLCEHAPGMPRLHFGYKVIDVETGETLAVDKGAELFTPASNNKLYTTAFSLMRLGPDFRFITELRTHGAGLPGTTVLPDLQLVGGGDPNLSGRVVPYRVDAPEGDPLTALRDFGSKLKQRGITAIDGDVTGVSTRYGGPLYPDGWATDDLAFGYGAPVSSLVVNDNTITLSLLPTEEGELADIQVQPAVPYLVLLNQVQTVPAGKTDLHISQPLGSNEVVVWGTIVSGAGMVKADVAVLDPALFAAECLRAVLEDEGLTVRGEARSDYRSPADSAEAAVAGTILATRESAPLANIVQVINKVSQNLHTEILLRESALLSGPTADPVVERQRFLDTIGITRDGSGYDASDGSGLARQDKASPDATVALLRFMWQSGLKEVWMRSLPIGGVDGTMQSRLKGVTGAERVHAKTGFMGHVNTVSGYLQTGTGHWLAFSLMADDTLASDHDVRDFLDTFCATMLAE